MVYLCAANFLIIFLRITKLKETKTKKNPFLSVSMYLSNGICFKYLVFLSVALLLEIIKLPMCNGAAHNNESWTEAVVSSPAAEIKCGALQSVSGPPSLLQWELIASTLKVEIYVIAKSVLVFAFPAPDELPETGWPRAAESILPSAGRVPATVSGDSVPSTGVQLYSGYKARLTASPYSGRRRFLL